MHTVILKELVSVREKIPFASHELIGVFVAAVPERELAEIAVVGLFEELLGRTQSGLFHPVRKFHGRDALRECHFHNIVALLVGLLKRFDDLVVAHIGAERKFTVLERSGSIGLADIQTENLSIADDAVLLQKLADGKRT